MTDFKITEKSQTEILRVDADGIITVNDKRLDTCTTKELHEAIKGLVKSIGRDVFKDIKLQ